MTNEKKNIILITIDSLRKDHLSCYDSNYLKTPNIDKLASEGCVFNNAFAGGSNTVTSVTSFLTSIPAPFVRKEHQTIQEILRNNGYKTISYNPNVQLVYGFCRELGITRGFEKYDTLLGSTRERFEVPIEEGIGKIGQITTNLFSKNSIVYRLISNIVGYLPIPITKPAPRAHEINRKAISTLTNNDKPVFLWLFYLDVHNPYMPTKRTNSSEYLNVVSTNRKLRYFKKYLSIKDGEKLHSLYIEEIEQLDKEIGNLMSELKENGLYENSVIIFTADHGEQFGEHGDFGHGALYDEVISVPLIIKLANDDCHLKKIESLVSLTNIPSTIMEVANYNQKIFSGKSLYSSINSLEDERTFVLCFGNTSGDNYCLRTKRWKVIISNKKIELFNLEKDPMEKVDIYHDYTDFARNLQMDAISYLNNLKQYYAKSSEELKIKRVVEKFRKTM